MTQDIDTQTILDNLDKVIKNRDRWYEPFEYSWNFLASGFFMYRYFFPKEISEIVPLNDSRKEKIEKARKWYRDLVSEEDDDVVSLYEFPEPWPEMKVEPFRIMYEREFLDSCPERWNREGSLQLGKEMRKLDHVLFLSDEMAENYIKRTCPLLSSCVERWKILRALKEDLRIHNTQALG